MRIMLILLLLAGLIAFIPSCDQATGKSPRVPTAATKPALPQFSVNGIKIGDALSDEFLDMHCDRGNRPKDGHEPTEAGDEIRAEAGIINIQYELEQKKVVAIRLDFHPTLFSALVEIYTGKFGGPRTSDAGSADWETIDGTFSLEACTPAVKRGTGLIRSQSVIAKLEARRQERLNDLKQRL